MSQASSPASGVVLSQDGESKRAHPSTSPSSEETVKAANSSLDMAAQIQQILAEQAKLTKRLNLSERVNKFLLTLSQYPKNSQSPIEIMLERDLSLALELVESDHEYVGNISDEFLVNRVNEAGELAVSQLKPDRMAQLIRLLNHPVIVERLERSAKTGNVKQNLLKTDSLLAFVKLWDVAASQRSAISKLMQGAWDLHTQKDKAWPWKEGIEDLNDLSTKLYTQFRDQQFWQRVNTYFSNASALIKAQPVARSTPRKPEESKLEIACRTDMKRALELLNEDDRRAAEISDEFLSVLVADAAKLANLDPTSIDPTIAQGLARLDQLQKFFEIPVICERLIREKLFKTESLLDYLNLWSFFRKTNSDTATAMQGELIVATAHHTQWCWSENKDQLGAISDVINKHFGHKYEAFRRYVIDKIPAPRSANSDKVGFSKSVAAAVGIDTRKNVITSQEGAAPGTSVSKQFQPR